MIVLVMARVTKESILGPLDSRSVSMTNGILIFTINVQDLWELEIPVALVPRLLSNTDASPSETFSLHPILRGKNRGAGSH